MNLPRQADVIKVAAVITATPRWVGALLAAEGFMMPEAWGVWWVPISAIFSAGMALVEGFAFAFVFNAWRLDRSKTSNRLLWLAMLSALVFILVLAPFIAAQVRAETLETVLGTGWALWLWSASVAASTIVIVASVGYAQKQRPQTQAGASAARIAAQESARVAQHICWCGEARDTQQGLAAHTKKHANEARSVASLPAALELFEQLYPSRNGGPSTEQVIEWRK